MERSNNDFYKIIYPKILIHKVGGLILPRIIALNVNEKSMNCVEQNFTKHFNQIKNIESSNKNHIYIFCGITPSLS